ncbi:beta-lactamase domain-containing protein [Rhodopirellula maiorica SM1]|uniref:Beta-lactamase domain-containing protein n=1 Tax=Rhodopirellula maiorica SM1 TaxID=1265738 RepID=M5RPS7_9BACT|nr:MBL fold metallo-hydrolase [Rhodopirellula maiorica]EMI21226.1 beta-lactamase domain-containing protein [Rhodopirellula maiorica SM1]
MTSWIPLGEMQLLPISGGRLRIDGGNMFGVVPRMLWQQVAVPDEEHRIRVETNCLLVRTTTSLGLIDCGYGSKAAEKIRRRLAMEPDAPLVRNLQSHRITPEDIDWVILTHLHFDHAGGCTYRDENHRLQPTFHRARHYVQQVEWDDGVGNVPELAGSYFQDDFLPLAEAGLLQWVNCKSEIEPGITVSLTGGHTRGHQMVKLKSQGETAIYPADLCPMVAHLQTFWTLAYDQFPLIVRRLKPSLIRDIVEHDRLMLFSHDPDIAAARLRVDAGGRLGAEPVFT